MIGTSLYLCLHLQNLSSHIEQHNLINNIQMENVLVVLVKTIKQSPSLSSIPIRGKVKSNDNFDDFKIYNLLVASGVDIHIQDQEEYNTWNSYLPSWKHIQSLYYKHGDIPLVHGIETSCFTFQQTIPPHKRFISPTGMFNSGTNLLYYSLLDQYCIVLPQRTPRHLASIASVSDR